MSGLQEILNIAVPAIAFFLTVLVGMDLTVEHFRKLKQSRNAIFAGTIGQYLLPVAALVVLKILRPDPEIAAGLILISVSPGGGISNYFTYLARANTALSVVLTTFSCLTAAVTMPLLLRGFESFLGQRIDFHVPLNVLFGQLFLLLIAPLILGFAIRRYRPEFVARFNKPLRLTGVLAMAWLIGFVIYQTRQLFLETWEWISLTALCFVLISMAIGYVVGRALKTGRADSVTLVIEYGVRNIAIATAIAVVILRRTEFATFGAIFFLMETLLIMTFILIFRRQAE